MEMTHPFLRAELKWLDQAITATMEGYFQDTAPPWLPPMPETGDDVYGGLVKEHRLGPTDRTVLILALAPHLQPALLDPFTLLNPNTTRPFSEFGGEIRTRGGFAPSFETALFLLSGGDLDRRLALLQWLDADPPLLSEGLLSPMGAPGLATALEPAPGLVQRLATGHQTAPTFGADFPAQRLDTQLSWDNLVLSQTTLTELERIVTWITVGDGILRDTGLGRRLAPGLRALFSGPPGTGKTLSAALLGQRTGRPVYRVDLSQVVSKWIGETEKNLANLFALAKGHNWILFFDEADALFGARTQTTSANDRFANQEVSYLLQRIEQFEGITLLATNLKGNIDPAFLRRFEHMVRFSVPGPAERERLWRAVLGQADLVEDSLDIPALSQTYTLTGAMVSKALRRALITAHQDSLPRIPEGLLRASIEREIAEAGRLSDHD